MAPTSLATIPTMYVCVCACFTNVGSTIVVDKIASTFAFSWLDNCHNRSIRSAFCPSRLLIDITDRYEICNYTLCSHLWRMHSNSFWIGSYQLLECLVDKFQFSSEAQFSRWKPNPIFSYLRSARECGTCTHNWQIPRNAASQFRSSFSRFLPMDWMWSTVLPSEHTQASLHSANNI